MNIFHNLSIDFFRERAIVLGQMDRHEQSLAVYVHVLLDNKMAERYGMRLFSLYKTTINILKTIAIAKEHTIDARKGIEMYEFPILLIFFFTYTHNFL